MANSIRKLIFFLLFLMFFVSNTNASASVIDLFAQNSSNPVQYTPGTKLQVDALARGLGSYDNFIYDFDPDAYFHLFAERNSDNEFYSGNLSVITPSLEIILKATFSNLTISSTVYPDNPKYNSTTFWVKDLEITESILDVDTAGEGLQVYGRKSSMGAFQGQIIGVKLPQETPMDIPHAPEPATAMLLGLGLLGLAGLGRRKK